MKALGKVGERHDPCDYLKVWTAVDTNIRVLDNECVKNLIFMSAGGCQLIVSNDHAFDFLYED